MTTAKIGHMPTVLILTPFYYPESNAAAKRLTALADHLATENRKIKVVTQLPHHPENRIHPGFEHQTGTSDVGAIEVSRIKPWLVDRGSLPVRLIAELRFSLMALPKVLKEKPAVLIASSPYMFLGPLGYIYSRLSGARFIWDVRDLTWHYPAAAGKRTFGLDRVLDWIMKGTARRADALTATTVAQIEYFGKRPKASLFIPNGVTDEILDRLTALPEPLPKPRTRVLYAGLFGYNQNLGLALEAAAELPDVDFVLVGDGPDRSLLLDKVARAELDNVQIKPHMPFDDLVEEYAAADIMLSQVRDSPIFQYMQSAKVWEYMATGRPLIHAGVGDSVELLSRHRVGVPIQPGSVSALVNAINYLITHPEEGKMLADNAREFVSENYRRSQVLQAYGQLVDRLLNS